MEEEEAKCRICHGSGEEPLYYPCACKGSIKYVHNDCLIGWLSLKRSDHCEICGQKFAFSPVEAPWLLIARSFLNTLLLYLYTGCIWLVFFPTANFWMWRMAIFKSLPEVEDFYMTRFLMPEYLIGDCLKGYLICAGILAVYLLLDEHWDLVFMDDARPGLKIAKRAFRMSAKFMGVGLLVPFTIGRLVFNGSTIATVAAGYGVLLLLLFLCLGVALLKRYLKDGRIRGKVHVYVLEIVRIVASKESVFLINIFIIYLLLLGWWFAICMRPAVKVTFGRRLASLFGSSVMSYIVHWFLGLLYAIFTTIHTPKETSLRDKLCQWASKPLWKIELDIFLECASSLSHVVLVVFAPAKLATFLAPSIIPLDIRVSQPLPSMISLCIIAPYVFRQLSTIKSVIIGWSYAHYALFLLLVNPCAPLRRYHEDNTDDNAVAHNVMIFLILSVALIPFNTFLLIVPVAIGRAVVTLPMGDPTDNTDTYAFTIGCLVMGSIIAATNFIYKNWDAKQVVKWSAIIVKSSILLFLWVIVVPVVIGLLLDLKYVLPFTASLPSLYRDWAFGLLAMKICAWREFGEVFGLRGTYEKIELAKADGFSGLRGWWIFCEIIMPLLLPHSLCLCVPYAFVLWLGVPYRFAWLSFELLSDVAKLLIHVFRVTREQRRVLDRKIVNYDEEP